MDDLYWSPIGWVEGSGNSQQTINYNYNDDISGLSYPSVIYYRIKQVDINGAFEYSQVVSVLIEHIERESQIHVYPNPTSSELNISENVVGYTYELISSDFKTISGGVFLENRLNVSNLASGTYYLIINDGDFVKYTISFVKTL